MSDELNQEVSASWETPIEAEVPAVVATPAEPEAVVVPEPEPVVEVVATPEPAAVVETPAAEEAKSKKPAAAAASYQDGEVVVLSKLVLSSKERNSRSVALVQEQLISKGYADADMDKRGWYRENTQKALLEFCGSEGINEATLKKLFSNTKVAIAY